MKYEDMMSKIADRRLEIESGILIGVEIWEADGGKFR